MIAATPRQGGAAWAVLQYVLGLERLGCRVWFIEPFGGDAAAFARSADYCAAVMDRFGLGERWALLPPPGIEPAGMPRERQLAAAADAELLINVSGMLRDEELLGRIPARVYLDLDPAFTQLWHAVDGVDMGFALHNRFVTLADSIGRPGSLIPDCGVDWSSTLPPVVLDEWPFMPGAGEGTVTTVGHWRSYGSVEHGGVHFGQRAHSLRALLDVPRRAPAPVAPALAIDPGDERDLAALAEHGWTLVDPDEVAAWPDRYRRFVQDSWAELGVAKSGYVVSDSGWFSDRSACYLASGRPVAAQDTGFGRRLPTGAGLLAFRTEDDAVLALEEIAADYERHRAAARAIAVEHLDSDAVLGRLLEEVAA